MRLAFSVAINVDADILLVDEILAVGDANFQKKCFNKLKQIKENGTTIVIVSHSLQQIESICDKSIWINDGVIADEIAISIYQNSGIDMKITGATNGAWTLVVGKDSGIENLEDLKGKKMAISENTMIDYLSDYIAEENGVNSSEIEKIAIPAMPARLEALRN